MATEINNGAPGPVPLVQRQRTLRTWHIIVLIVAAMTPLSALVGTVPLALGLGGPSVAMMFIVAAVTVGIFCIGYAQMVRRIDRPGAFYSYISRGLGKPAGVGTAMLAAVAYPIAAISVATVQAVVTQSLLKSTWSIDIDWRWLLVVEVVLVTAAAWRRIDFTARMLSVIVVVEVALIIALVVAVLVNHGVSAFPATTFAPPTLKIGDWQVALIFALISYQGFEAGAMYAPEARKPGKTVPRALFGALVILTAVTVLAAWALTGLSGEKDVMRVVAEHGFTGYVFTVVHDNLGVPGLYLVSLAVIVAQLACSVGITSFMSRYLSGLAKDRILPSGFARQNRHHAPGAAILFLAVVSLVVPLGLGIVGVDPYTQLSSAGFGLGAIAATAIQAVASVAVIAFFFRDHGEGTSVWTVRVAPAVATVLLAVAFVIEVKGFSNITGEAVHWTAYLPWALPAIWLFGIGFALYLKARRPAIYDGIAAGDTAEEAEVLHAHRS